MEEQTALEIVNMQVKYKIYFSRFEHHVKVKLIQCMMGFIKNVK